MTSKDAGDATIPRAPVVCDEWREVFIDAKEAGKAGGVVVSFQMGYSMLQLNQLASPAECETLRNEATLAASVERERLRLRRIEYEAEVPRFGTKVAKNDETKGRVRMPVVNMLEEPGQSLADQLLVRAVASVDQEPTLQAILSNLFGQALECDAHSEPTILHSRRLGFTNMEPAINVYRQGGCFLPHTDKQSLTILIPLSDASNFDGGGTAFWPMTATTGAALTRFSGRGIGDMPADAPSLLLTPEAGTTLVFGGNVTHAGQPVLSGERCVLVASFSPLSKRDWW